MINTDMRYYNYFTFGAPNEYGQPQLSAEPKGKVKMNINISSQTIQDNINYLGATYTGLTHSAEINDTFVIQYGEKRLKVLYVNPKGRIKQVYLAEL